MDGPVYESTVRPPQSPYDNSNNNNNNNRRPVDNVGEGGGHGRRRNKSPTTSFFAQPGTLAGELKGDSSILIFTFF